jgi:hypothetical protein
MRASRYQAAVSGWLRKAVDPALTAVISSPKTLRWTIILGTFLMIVKWPVLALLILWATVVWAVPLIVSDRREVARLASLTRSAEANVEILRTVLSHAAQKIERLEQELKDAKHRPPPPPPPPPESKANPLYRRVGLDENCPKFVAEAVRKAYRRHLHPDSRPAAQKAEAERRFKEAEAAFSEIWHLRGF